MTQLLKIAGIPPKRRDPWRSVFAHIALEIARFRPKPSDLGLHAMLILPERTALGFCEAKSELAREGWCWAKPDSARPEIARICCEAKSELAREGWCWAEPDAARQEIARILCKAKSEMAREGWCWAEPDSARRSLGLSARQSQNQREKGGVGQRQILPERRSLLRARDLGLCCS